MQDKTADTSLTHLILSAVALAMSVAVVVLSVLGTVEPQTAVMLLGIGLGALGLDALQDA